MAGTRWAEGPTSSSIFIVIPSVSEKEHLIRFPRKAQSTLRESIVDHGPNTRGALSEADRAVLATSAEPEPLLDHVAGIGATLILTETRVIVVRQGAHFRPRSGVRAWPLRSISEIRLIASRRGSGSIVIRTGPYPWQAVNVFVGAQDSADAERIVAQIRSRSGRVHRPAANRRRDTGLIAPGRPAADPSGDD
jgi:hypothetical protein